MESHKAPQSDPSLPVSYDNNPGAAPFHPNAPPPSQPGQLPGSTLPHHGAYNQPPPAYHPNGIYQAPPVRKLHLIISSDEDECN